MIKTFLKCLKSKDKLWRSQSNTSITKKARGQGGHHYGDHGTSWISFPKRKVDITTETRRQNTSHCENYQLK